MFKNITEIKNHNKAMGYHFFDRETLDAFGSTVYPEIYHGKYFITSEKNSRGDKTLFTIREAKPDGKMGSVGNFNQYASFAEAQAVVKALKED